MEGDLHEMKDYLKEIKERIRKHYEDMNNENQLRDSE